MSTSVVNSLGSCVSFRDADELGMTKVTSLRRTLSADMSSKTWSVETGFVLNTIVPSVVDEADGRRVEKDDTNRPSRASQIDIWSSILSQKNDSHSGVPSPPYVHPLVKRSGSLSKKSLEICTESLGSETGSDVFSSFPSSDISSPELVKIENDQKVHKIVEDVEDVQVVKYNCAYHNKKLSGPRSFPPPLPSLARHDGGSLHMHSHRENGRLVLAAVSIPIHNNFHAQRQDGRLLLTFIKENNSNLPEAINKNKISNHHDVASDEQEDGELEEINTKKNMTMEVPKVTAIGVIHVQSPTFIVNKVISLASRSRHTSIWTNKFNTQLDPNSTAQPRLTSQPPSMTSATFNAYEYCWRRKSAQPTTPVFNTNPNDTRPSSTIISKTHNMFILTKSEKDSTNKNGDRILTNFLVLKGKVGEGHFIVPYFKGCKDPKRSLIFREPYCIATS